MPTKTASSIIWIPALEKALSHTIQKTLLGAQYSCELAPLSSTQFQRVFVRDKALRRGFEWAGDGYLSCAISHLLFKFFPDRPLRFYAHTCRALCRNTTFTMLMCKTGLAPKNVRPEQKAYADIFEMLVGVLWFDGELDILDDWIEDTFLELATAAEERFHLFTRLRPLHATPATALHLPPSASSPADGLVVAPCTADPAVPSPAVADPSTFTSPSFVAAAAFAAAMTSGFSSAPGTSASSSLYPAASPSSSAGPSIADTACSVKGCHFPTTDRPAPALRATSPSPRPDPLPTLGRDALVPTAVIFPDNRDHSQRQSPRKRHRASDAFFPTPERGEKRQKLSNAPFLEIRNRVPPSDLLPLHTPVPVTPSRIGRRFVVDPMITVDFPMADAGSSKHCPIDLSLSP
ncbi:hypothetical protein FPV67DRAFT_1777870 [Lyophyllum atratum]|nr:hypothetical protein FPV67DRAFT_1777870 [Lyophyllum atratum]